MDSQAEPHESLPESEFVSIRLVGADRAPIAGCILDATGRGMAIISNDPYAPPLAVGARVEAHFELGPNEYRVPSIVRSVASVLDVERYAIDFVAPDDLHDTDSDLIHRIFDRRLSQRVDVSEARVQATIRVESLGETVPALVSDISPSGMLVTRLADSEALKEGQHVLVDFTLPGRNNALRMAGVVRASRGHATSDAADTTVAIRFQTEGTSPSSFTRGAILEFVSRHIAELRRAG